MTQETTTKTQETTRKKEEITSTTHETTKQDVYNALYKASKQIGANNFKKQMAAWLKKGRRRHTFKFTVSDIHDEITKAMPKVIKGTMSINEGMALLHTPEAMNERF